MAKGKLSVRLGNKVLTLDDDGQADADFERAFAAVCKTNPASLQEFFERLVELQKGTSNKRPRSVRGINKNRGNRMMN